MVGAYRAVRDVIGTLIVQTEMTKPTVVSVSIEMGREASKHFLNWTCVDDVK
jgi:hypothetical protein